MKFEQSLLELEVIADKLEDKNITLDESMELFNEGVQKCAKCLEDLKKASGKIQELVVEMDKLIKQPFEVE